METEQLQPQESAGSELAEPGQAWPLEKVSSIPTVSPFSSAWSGRGLGPVIQVLVGSTSWARAIWLAASLVAKPARNAPIPDAMPGAREELAWSNTEHTATPPDLSPEPGLMQGAAGVAGWLAQLAAAHRGAPNGDLVGLTPPWI